MNSAVQTRGKTKSGNVIGVEVVSNRLSVQILSVVKTVGKSIGAKTMSHKTNNTNKDQEQAYQCQECGSIWPETTIAVRPISKVLYCRSCQSEDVKLVVEEEGI